MAGVVVTIAISVFLGGVMVGGVLAVMAIAIRREDRRHTLVGRGARPAVQQHQPADRHDPRQHMGDEFLRPAGKLVR